MDATPTLEEGIKARIAAIHERLRRAPLDIPARAELVRLHLRIEQPGEALRQIDVIEKLEGIDASLHVLKARAVTGLERMGTKRRTEIGLLRGRLAADPADTRACLRLLRALREENVAAAIEQGLKCLAIAPEAVELRVALVELLLQACLYEQAEVQVRQLQEIAPGLQRGHVLAARTMARTGRGPEAEACYSRARELGSLSDQDADLFEKLRQARCAGSAPDGGAPSPILQLHNDSISLLNLGYSTRFEEAKRYLAKQRGKEHRPRVLSFGCSVGNEVALLKASFPDALVFGCDVDESALRIATANHADERTTIFRSNASNLDRHRPFDLITCMSVLCRYPASEHIDDMSGPLPFSRFQSVLDLMDGSLSVGGILVLWNAVYPFSRTRQASYYQALPSRILGLNGYTSVFHPEGRRLTRFMRRGPVCAQQILSNEAIDTNDLACVMRRKIALDPRGARLARLGSGVRDGVRALFGLPPDFAAPPPDGRIGPNFERAGDFSAGAAELEAKAEAIFGLRGQPYVVGGFGIEIFRHKKNTRKFKGRWHYGVAGTQAGMQAQSSSIVRDMSAPEVAAFLV